MPAPSTSYYNKHQQLKQYWTEVEPILGQAYSLKGGQCIVPKDWMSTQLVVTSLKTKATLNSNYHLVTLRSSTICRLLRSLCSQIITKVRTYIASAQEKRYNSKMFNSLFIVLKYSPELYPLCIKKNSHKSSSKTILLEKVDSRAFST